jgi:hypothetical protein
VGRGERVRTGSSWRGVVVSADAGSRVLSRDEVLGLGPRRRQPVQPASQRRSAVRHQPPGRHHRSARVPPTAAGLARGPSSRATPSPSWTYLDTKCGDDRERRRTGPGARVSPRRSARQGATPGTLLRSSVERSPVCGRARLQFLPGSRAPPVHLLGFAARTQRSPGRSCGAGSMGWRDGRADRRGRDETAGPPPPTLAIGAGHGTRYVHEGEGVARDDGPRARRAARGRDPCRPVVSPGRLVTDSRTQLRSRLHGLPAGEHRGRGPSSRDRPASRRPRSSRPHAMRIRRGASRRAAAAGTRDGERRVELVVVAEDAILVEGEAAIRGQVGGEARARAHPIVQRVELR